MKVTKQACVLFGVYSRAWQCDLDAIAKDSGQENNGTTLGMWIIYAPWAHPLWQYYNLALIHLRPVPGMPPATINLPGATHEIMLHAMDPDHEPESDKDPHPHFLVPTNFAGQWIAESDEAAIKYVEGVIQEICDGTLSPDTDWLREWIRRFSDSNVKPQYRDPR